MYFMKVFIINNSIPIYIIVMDFIMYFMKRIFYNHIQLTILNILKKDNEYILYV